MRISVILPAAGLGKRFAAAAGVTVDAKLGGKSKIEFDLQGKPVFMRAIELFVDRPGVSQIILAVNPDSIDDFRFRWSEKLAFTGVKIVPGGRKERWETVLNALRHVEPEASHVAIHDAARPLTSPRLIDRVFDAAAKFKAVIPGLPASATLKRVKADEADRKADPFDAILGGVAGDAAAQVWVKRVVATVDRSDIVEVQTPQVFEVNLLRKAYERISACKVEQSVITDDAALVESIGETVRVVDGESTNIKVTRPEDLTLASAFLEVNEKKTLTASARKKLFRDDDE
jgi:2-C-methyl-D-erythritol 4-phosphate cytidylyltransferase